MKRLSQFFFRLWRNTAVGVTLDDMAEAIHDADDRARGAWPFEGEERSFAPGAIRLATDEEIDTRRRQARAAARVLGIKLVEG